MSSRKRTWDGEYVEVDPSKRRRSESYVPAGSPYRHNFRPCDRFLGRQSQKYELFFGWQSPFSQHHPVKFTVDGKEFNCAEQYYMYRKAALFKDKEIEEKIMNSRDPKEQKRLGKQIQNFDFDTWMQHSKEVVEKGNMAKFSQNPHLKKKLFATAPRLMVEASPYDATWGIALHKYDPRALDERTWQGQNLLGQIITKVRDNLMRQDGHLDDKECNSDGSIHGSPVTLQQRTDSQASSSRRDSTNSFSTQRSPVSKEQKMHSRAAGSRRHSERDSDCGWIRSPARKKQRTDGQDSYSTQKEEKERKCERRREKEPRRRKSLERSRRKSDSEETGSDSDSSSSSEDSDRESRRVVCQTPNTEKQSRKKKKKSRKECSSSSEASLDGHDRSKRNSNSSASSKRDLEGMDKKNKSAELCNCIGGEGEWVDGEDNVVVSGRGERQGDTDKPSKERTSTSIQTDKDGGCMHSKVVSESNCSGELAGQQKNYDTEDGKRLSSSVPYTKHDEMRTGSEGQIGDTQRRQDRDMEMLQDDKVTEKILHGGGHNVDVGALETGRKTKEESSEHQESTKDDHLVMKGKGESEKADEKYEKEVGETEKGEDKEDGFPTVVETRISDIPQSVHVPWENMDTENTIADTGSDRSDNESKKMSRDEVGVEPQQETMMKLITDHKMAAVGSGAGEGDGQVKEDSIGGQAECQMIHIKPFKKSAQRHYRDKKKVSDTDSGEMDAGSRRSRKQRLKSGDRMRGMDRRSRDGSSRTSQNRSRTKHIDNVSRSNKDLYERTNRDINETRHAIRRNSVDHERSRKRDRDRSRNFGNGSDDRTSHWKDSETSKKDKDMLRKDRGVYEDNIVRKESESSKHKDKDIKDSHNRTVIGGDDSDARDGERPKEHKQRKHNNDNCTSRAQKKKKKKKKTQEIREKRNKKKAQRKEMRKQRKALQKERSRTGGQGNDDKGER